MARRVSCDAGVGWAVAQERLSIGCGVPLTGRRAGVQVGAGSVAFVVLNISPVEPITHVPATGQASVIAGADCWTGSVLSVQAPDPPVGLVETQMLVPFVAAQNWSVAHETIMLGP
jgi:hypothetical protein